MFDDIDPRSPTPLYAQIAARVRVGVASEELVPGEALPSVRALARALRVSPASVVQAYLGLGNDGFVDIRHAQGTFVRDIPPPRREEERAAQAKRLVRRLLQDGARLGIGADEMTEAFEAETGAKTLD
jgi:GntR family transcriptional regulator